MNIGIDIGGTSFKFGVVDNNGNVIFKDRIPVDKSLTQEEQIRKLGYAVLDFLVEHEIDKSSIEGIGIGCPGAIDSVHGICDYSNNLGYSNLPVCKIITEVTKLESKISNDANAAALGEAKYGVGRGKNNIIMLTLGTGVGGGIILDGKLYEGQDGKGAELGHAVIQHGGLKCTCGRHGCLEMYASTSALIRYAKEEAVKNPSSILVSFGSKIDGKAIFDCAHKGDKAALTAIDIYVDYLAVGLLNYCNIFRPDMIVLGGGISEQGDFLIDKVKAIMKKEHYGFPGTPMVQIKQATLGNDSGIVGAVALVSEN